MAVQQLQILAPLGAGLKEVRRYIFHPCVHSLAKRHWFGGSLYSAPIQLCGDSRAGQILNSVIYWDDMSCLHWALKWACANQRRLLTAAKIRPEVLQPSCTSEPLWYFKNIQMSSPYLWKCWLSWSGLMLGWHLKKYSISDFTAHAELRISTLHQR